MYDTNGNIETVSKIGVNFEFFFSEIFAEFATIGGKFCIGEELELKPVEVVFKVSFTQ